MKENPVKMAVEARHMEVTDSMKQYMDSKLTKLPRIYHSIQSVDVILDREAVNWMVEIVVTGPKKHTFVASHRNTDMYACVDQCFSKIEGQLRRFKDKVRNHHGLPHSEITAPVSE